MNMSNEFDPNPYDNVSVDEALTQIYERCNDRTIRQMVTTLKSAIDTGGGGLPADTKIGSALSMSIDPLTFVVTAILKDQDGENLGSTQTIDLPLETVVVDGTYNAETEKVVLTLQNGNTIEFSVASLVAGLQSQITDTNKLAPELIDYNSTHRAVTDAEKSTWSGKQNAISDLSTIRSGAAAGATAVQPAALSSYQPLINSSNKLNPALLDYDSSHRSVSDTEKSTWNNKQSRLSASNKLDSSFIDFTIGQIKVLSSGITYDLVEAFVNRIGKNLLNISKAGIKAANKVGTWTDNTYTRTDDGNNITITMNADMSFTISGSTTKRITFILQNTGISTFSDCMLSASVDGEPIGTDLISTLIQLQTSPWTNLAQSVGPGAYIPSISPSDSVALSINISAGLDLSEPVTVYPMVCKSDEYGFSNQYVPPYVTD
jgi:hypothetical protein